MKYFLMLVMCVLHAVSFAANDTVDTDSQKQTCETSETVLQGFGEIGALVKAGDYAPLYQVNNQHGLLSPLENNVYARVGIDFTYRYKALHLDAGADVVGNAVKYSPFFKNHVRLQQLYAGIGVGKAELEFGMREHDPDFVNPDLSSGNMVWSENSRPVPMLRLKTKGFVGICNWLSFKLDAGYGKMLDGDYRQAEYDAFMAHYDNVSPYHFSPLAKDSYIHHKSFFLRTKEDAPVVLTVGGEHAATFGGVINGTKMDVDFKNIMDATFFRNADGGEENNQMASFDARIDANMKSYSLGIYGQLFMDDISKDGGKENGMDGLWGIEYTAKEKSVINNVVFEYLQTSNQSGPVYTGYEDYKYGTLGKNYSKSHYYNDQLFGPWSNYGLANGSPMLSSTIYNKDNAPLFLSTLVRAFHLGVKGYVSENLTYKVKAGILNSWGESFALFPEKKTDFSMLAEMQYVLNRDLTIKASAAFDSGTLYGDNGGFMLTVRKSLSYKK